jgi:hypothetical protein
MILTIGLIVLGIVSIVLLIVIMLFFGTLIKTQFRRWRLARKGYIEVEHISETNLRQYMIMKPSDKSFDFFEGFFLYDSEAVTRGERNVLKNYDRKEIEEAITISEQELNEIPDDKKKAKIREIKALYKTFNKLKFNKEALTFRYGMPIISYYGDKPEPVMFRDLKRNYSSTFIKDMYLRLLLTQRYNDFKKFITFGLIIAGVVGLALLGILYYLKGLTADLQVCHNILNTTLNHYEALVNQTITIKALGNSVVI